MSTSKIEEKATSYGPVHSSVEGLSKETRFDPYKPPKTHLPTSEIQELRRKENDTENKENIEPEKTKTNDNNKFITKDPKKQKEDFRNYDDPNKKNSQRQEQVRKFYENQHINMTYDFVKKQHDKYLKFNMIKMNIWDMLLYLNTVVDESDPDTDLTQVKKKKKNQKYKFLYIFKKNKKKVL